MVNIETTLKNFSFIGELNAIFPDTDGFEYTKKGVIRSISKPICSCCGNKCVRNGWDPITRKDLFLLKIGKFHCPFCNTPMRSDTSFFDRFIDEWEQTLSAFFLRLSDRDVAVRVISELMNFLTPMSKDGVLRRIYSAIKKLVIPEVQCKYQIVHYDEQHPKKGRNQKYRLTLICAITGKVIADELVDNKDYERVRKFLEANLDTKKETIIITDDCPWYPNVFEDIWGNKVRHQLCILHLNKLIVEDCGRVKNLHEMYDTYLELGILFDRSKELQFIEMLLSEQENINEKEHEEWLKCARKKFNRFVRSLEKMRRRDKQNHTLKTLEQAEETLRKLKGQIDHLQKPLRKRLKYIEKHWKQFTLFYHIDDCPHTNNIIENYFSTSLKTHRKKQFRTDEGLENKMKLSRFKRNIGLPNVVRSFFDWARIFWILGIT